MVCALLAICILMQALVNTFNDYYDFVKGADSEEDNVDITDAVLVYNHINPASALRLAVGLLVAAFAIGVYVIYCAGWIPLVLNHRHGDRHRLFRWQNAYLPPSHRRSGDGSSWAAHSARVLPSLTGELNFVVLCLVDPNDVRIRAHHDDKQHLRHREKTSK